MKLKPNEQFTIRITKVGFGNVDQSKPFEVVPTETRSVRIEDDVPIAELDTTVDERISFTVLVRDKYGNPISNVDVTASGGGSVDESNIERTELSTNDEGKATFTYTPTSTGTKTIEVTSSDVNSAYDTATYEFNVEASEDDEDDDSDDDDETSIIETSCSASGEGTITISNIYDHAINVEFVGGGRGIENDVIPANAESTYTYEGSPIVTVSDDDGEIAEAIPSCG